MEVRLCEAILASHEARRWKSVAGVKARKK
jgi:hypothetical protein